MSFPNSDAYRGSGINTIRFTSEIDTLNGDSQGNNFHADFSKVRNVERIELSGSNHINLGDVLPTVGINTIVLGDGDTTLRYDHADVGTIKVDAGALADGKDLVLNEFSVSTAGHRFDIINLKGDIQAAGLTLGSISVTAAAGSGFDVSIQSGGGNDTLNGGAGDDSLSGGAGNDVFVYATLTDSVANGSTTGPAGADTITDFVVGNDVFRVSADVAGVIGGGVKTNTQAWNTDWDTTITAAFTATGISAHGVLQLEITGSNAGTYLIINDAAADYNAASDAVIILTGMVGTLDVGNFVTG